MEATKKLDSKGAFSLCVDCENLVCDYLDCLDAAAEDQNYCTTHLNQTEELISKQTKEIGEMSEYV